MPWTRPRRWLTALLLLILPVAGGWAAAPSAAAAGHEGACTDDTGVTVVVDHQGLGGGVVVRCAPDFPGGTGLDALRLAGFTPVGTIKEGSSFVCRISNRPAADEVITAGGQSYREDCIQTPPGWAFWGYWHSTAGGGWTFSDAGAARAVEPGGYEGWSFSIDRPVGQNPPPGYTPKARPEPTTAQPTTTPATSAPAPTIPPPVPSKDAPSETVPASTTSTTRPAKTSTSPTATPTASPTRTPSPSATPTQPASPTPSPSPTSTGTGTATATATSPATTAAETAEPVEATQPREDGWLGTSLSVGGVLLIAGAGAVVWWRRRNLV